MPDISLIGTRSTYIETYMFNSRTKHSQSVKMGCDALILLETTRTKEPAQSIVANGLARKAIVQVSYALGNLRFQAWYDHHQPRSQEGWQWKVLEDGYLRTLWNGRPRFHLGSCETPQVEEASASSSSSDSSDWDESNLLNSEAESAQGDAPHSRIRPRFPKFVPVLCNSRVSDLPSKTHQLTESDSSSSSSSNEEPEEEEHHLQEEEVEEKGSRQLYSFCNLSTHNTVLIYVLLTHAVPHSMLCNRL
ncbi:hypothetical protein ACFX1Z_038070 [Malus domestica]